MTDKIVVPQQGLVVSEKEPIVVSVPADQPVIVEAHVQAITNRYMVHYPDHSAREDDPHYVDFNHLHRRWKKDPDKWQCDIGRHRGDFSECDLDKPLELHHHYIEFAVMNAVEMKWLAKDYPGIDTPEEVGAWVESAVNLLVLCVRHHRGHGGIHHASAADYEAQRYVRGLIT